MSRLRRPLNREAVRAADNEFYANHPELVKQGKRMPLSETNPRHADLRQEWASLYTKRGGQIEEDQDRWPAKKPDDPLQACPIQPQNWVELEYLYCDGTAVTGAHYTVRNNDGGGVVAQGILDATGYAWCALPVSINNVSYNFDKDPPTVEYLHQPVANPEQAKIKAGWFERMAARIAAAGSWTWETLQGDFNEDQTVGQVATNAVITMLPIVDQVGDVRDLTANLKFLIWDKRYNDKWVWIAIVLTLIGLIPVVGSAAKGVLKTVAKALKSGEKVSLKLLIEVLNRFHKGNAITWLRQLAADLPSHAVVMKRRFRDILQSLREKLKSLADTLPGSLGRKADEAVSAIDEVAAVADAKIDEAVKELQDGLNRSLDEGVDFEQKGTTKTKNTRQQTDAEPPTQPTGSLGGKPTGKRTTIRDQDDSATKRSLQRENDSADALANSGYKVEQNPTVPDGKNPDYLIDGKRFDNKAPTTARPRNAASEMEKAVREGQADRIVLNLEDSPIQLDAMKQQLDAFPIEGLKEVIVIKNGQVIPFWP